MQSVLPVSFAPLILPSDEEMAQTQVKLRECPLSSCLAKIISFGLSDDVFTHEAIVASETIGASLC